MKRIVFNCCILCGLLISISASAQGLVSYSYDSAGNRNGRAWTTQRPIERLEADSLVSVIIPVCIDSLSPKSVRYEMDYDHKSIPLVLSEDEKQWFNDNFLKKQLVEEQAWWEDYSRTGARLIDTTKAVGAIPLQEGISPTGSRTYNLPIPTAAGLKLVPTISLAYNSQAAEGWAGYGWDIQGVSCIKLINKNQYYHGTIKAADVNASDPVFAIDGVPLVTNEHGATSSAYPLESAKGHILAAPEYNTYGKICRFTVLYPNGMHAVFGHGGTNNNTLVYYYLTELQDMDGNRITFSYFQDTLSGHDRLYSIRYGYNTSGNYSGEITFSYFDWTNCPSRYFAGTEILFNKRLASVQSYSKGYLLSEYSFNYEQKGALWLLNRIDCTSSGESLNPVVLTYSTVPSSHYLKKDTRSITLNPTLFPPDSMKIYIRGKFVPYEYRDGILVHPRYNPYIQKGGNPQQGFFYGSNYPYSQKISCIARLEGSDESIINTDLDCGNGFQAIDAIDVDGDGVDEIVRLNTTIVSQYADKTKLTITVYRCNTAGAPIEDYSFYVFLKGDISTLSYRSPYNRALRWGDFNGDGKAELLAVAYNSNYNLQYDPLGHSYPQTCYVAVVDPTTRSVLSDEVISSSFIYKINKPNCLIVNDIDNDGKCELCLATGTGFDIYRLQTNGHFVLESHLSSPSETVIGDSDRPCYFADINGDGYLDIARTPNTETSSVWTIYYYTGTNFSPRTVCITSKSSFTDALFMDVNRDGMADMVTIKEAFGPSDTLGTYINQNGYTFGGFQLSPSNISDAKGIIPVNVSAYNQPSAFMKFDGFSVFNYDYYGITGSSRHITKVKDSYCKIQSNIYTYLPSRAQIWRDTSLTINTSQGYRFCTLPISVLSLENNYLSEAMTDAYHTMSYEYYNGVVHSRGLGFCGFSRTRTKEMAGPATFVVRDVEDIYRLPDRMGVVKNVIRKKGTGDEDPAYYTQTNTWDYHSTTYGKLDPHLIISSSLDALTGISSQTSYSYDTWDFPTETRTSLSKSGSNNHYERHVWAYQHCNTSTRYVLGNVSTEAIIQEIDGDTHRQWKNKTITAYDTLSHPITRQLFRGLAVYPYANPYMEGADSTLLVQETRWTYDSYGNTLSEKSAQYGASELLGHTYTYDTNGRFLLTDTDPLGHTTTYSGHNKFGKPKRVTDYRGRITDYTYDRWGRVTQIHHPDGTIEHINYAWGGKGTYIVTKLGMGLRETSVHYDALDREIRSGEKRFDGQWQWTDKEYNRYGQVSRESLPFRGTSASYWNSYTYDSFNRPITLTEASGKVTTWSYSGTSITTVKDDITSVSDKDASGNVVSIQDAGGMITYVLRDDAQPSKITAPGSVETTFAYDSYGRRTRLVDPSAGIQTEAYVWNADGSHEQTHSGPNGNITSRWDKYGRITSVLRSGEFNTTYAYDSYGLLSTAQSTNGTSVEYTYDSLDRIATVKETVPDSKWLKKTYTYGTGGVISAIQYTTQDEDITTETYNYSNGHNTGITIANNTTVWNLISENDFGVPTEVITGNINRQYGFTVFGLPTYRRMAGGNLQNFSYQFNAGNGNLNYRTDILNNKTETFTYDGLNRLLYTGGNTIVYVSNGNILSKGSVGSMVYGNTDHPYQVTSLIPASPDQIPNRPQDITYNSLGRPSLLEEGGKTAAFVYNEAGDRVRMQVTDGLTQELTRYYIGGQYECDITTAGTKERLYLGGDAYSSPMVLQKINNGSWIPYSIGRDYLGNITHIADQSGNLIAEYSYDPWGRLRNPATHAIYTPGTEPDLFLGRGFTGHEHLTWFGLINMNARLYDPLLGRFLSPDPLVQAPDFTQNFNRYSYALNNPLRYTDITGEFFFFDALFFGLFLRGDWEKAMQMAENDLNIWAGLFKVDKNKGFWGGAAELFSRFTWQLPQTLLGFGAAQVTNNIGFMDKVDYLHGATVFKTYGSWGGITIGNYIFGDSSIEASDDNRLFQHEYGHYLQSQEQGIFWLFDYAIPSFVDAWFTDYNGHNDFYAEQDANIRSVLYLSEHYGNKYAKEKWNIEKNPINVSSELKTSNHKTANFPVAIDIVRYPFNSSIFGKDNLDKNNEYSPYFFSAPISTDSSTICFRFVF